VGGGASAIAFGSFAVLFWASGYFFTLYKAQTEVYVMVPLDGTSVVKEFEVFLDVAVAFAAIGVAHTLYWQCNTDIFFLDWERPWTSASASSAGKHDAAPVSAWRKMFIANEWNELQALRMTSRELTLLLLVLLLEGLNYRNLGVVEPSMSLSDPRDYQVESSVLRFFVASGFMGFIVLCQVAYKTVFHHNYVEHPIQQFVDLLAMSNLSIVILDDECAGYYLHGRSLMTFADTSMAELMAQMRKEQEMQVAARGLVPSSQREDLAENQCFELFITKELRLAYESKLLRSIEETAATRGGDGFGGVLGVLFGGGRMAQSRAASRAGFMNSPGGWNGQGGGLPVSDSHGGLVDASLAAAEEIGDIFKQLISFVETNAASFVLERPFTNRLINMPPESVSSMQGASPIFYHDLQMSFVRTLWYGVEMQLFIFDVLVFCAVDKALDSFALAAFITWIVGACIDHARAAFGSANISRKSLIDERFLI
jgi:meckelin